MSLDKAIAHGKERRKPRRSPDASCYDRTPRNGCPWCQDSRTYQARREDERTRYEARTAWMDMADDWRAWAEDSEAPRPPSLPPTGTMYHPIGLTS